MAVIPPSINRLIEGFSRFPGIGKKTAQRMAYHLLNAPNEQAAHLAEAIMDLKQQIFSCTVCGSITEENPCSYCTDAKRDDNLLCVVEESADIYSFEKTNSFMGRYHVLGGVLSPLDGIGPEDLNIDNLLKRLKKGVEVILAVNPSIEGEATNLYLAKLIKQKGANVTRLARGLPVGGNLEFTDDATLVSALEGRTKL